MVRIVCIYTINSDDTFEHFTMLFAFYATHNVSLYVRMSPFPIRIKTIAKWVERRDFNMLNFYWLNWLTFTRLAKWILINVLLADDVAVDVDGNVHYYLNRLVLDWKWNRWTLSSHSGQSNWTNCHNTLDSLIEQITFFIAFIRSYYKSIKFCDRYKYRRGWRAVNANLTDTSHVTNIADYYWDRNVIPTITLRMRTEMKFTIDLSRITYPAYTHWQCGFCSNAIERTRRKAWNRQKT